MAMMPAHGALVVPKSKIALPNPTPRNPGIGSIGVARTEQEG